MRWGATGSVEVLATYQGVTPTGDATPCPMGAVHTKAAWLQLDEERAASGRYHTADALFFRTQEDGSTCMDSATFGLIGLHIIQRVHRGSSTDPNGNPLGGTFIFATWEHVDNDTAGFTYSNYFAGDGLEPPLRGEAAQMPATNLGSVAIRPSPNKQLERRWRSG